MHDSDKTLKLHPQFQFQASNKNCFTFKANKLQFQNSGKSPAQLMLRKLMQTPCAADAQFSLSVSHHLRSFTPTYLGSKNQLELSRRASL